MALPYRTTGSLCPTFVPARLVSLAVKHAYAIALSSRCPTVTSVPSNSSVTLWEETAPVKLPTMHCPRSRQWTQVRTSNTPGWYFNVGSMRSSDLTSKPPTYPTQICSKSNTKLQQRFMGSFRLSAGRLHHHKHFNFAESQEETVWPSLRHSCRSELTRQGISLPQDRYSYGRRLLGLQSRACTPSFNLPAPGRRHTLYVHFRVCRVLCFYQTVAATILLQPFCPPGAGQSNYLGVPYPEVTVPICRVPSPEFSQAPQNTHLAHLCRFAVRSCQTEAQRLFLEPLPIASRTSSLVSHP
eukprot:TRINITY_DN340_c0_g1_i12.p1 TRINITY_DN340_c0_g1~~TRINITY_DN340_c0_g1_i12.p1  ORF type:complete len:298 (+),score=-58.72 TRINITY_DN340_c0_g1_i12:268-1161(+)